MSRIGRQTIVVSDGVEVKIEGQKITCKGSKGELSFDFDNKVDVELKDKEIIVGLNDADKDNIDLNPIWGTTRAIINNLVKGVTEGFEKKLEINGVGYNAQASGKKITLNLGYSHPIELEIPEGIEIAVDKNIVTITGIDKQEVGQFAARIREHRKPEPYKGKGIRYIDEHVRRKAGKKAVGSEGGE